MEAATANDPTTTEPRSAAARRAAGDPPASPAEPAAPQGAPAPQDSGQAAAAPQATATPASAGVTHVVPPAQDELAVTPEEMDLVRALRAGRAAEIRNAIAAAPQQVGTDVDPYTLVHLRGCPAPDRTETYELRNTGTREMFTVHRCIQCGAHIAIPHNT